MHTILLLLFFLSQFLLCHGQLQLKYPAAKLNTTWINNRPFARNAFEFASATKMRVLLQSSASGPSFAGGFLCAPPCNGFLFSIFVVNTTILPAFHEESNDPPSVWSANRDRLVGENATLQFTIDGDLILRDADGTFVWSTNTSNRSVSSMNLTASGNLMLLNDKNETVWSSFDHPTDTLLNGQTLKHGQSLISNSTEANTTRGRLYLTLQKDGFYAYVNSNPPQVYTKLYSPPITNITLNNGFLLPGEYYTHLKISANWVVQFARFDLDGHFRLYGIGQNFLPGLTILHDFTNSLLDYCDYPVACGEYGICSDGQCSCPVNTSDGDSSFFKPKGWGHVNHGCSSVNPISCNSTEDHRLLPSGGILYNNYVEMNAAALLGTDEESCKKACLMNCSCKAAIFNYGQNFSQGDCYLPTEIFTLRNASLEMYNVTSAYIKIQIAPVTNRYSYPTAVDSSISLPKTTQIGTFLAIFGSIIFTSIVVSIVVWVIILRFRRRRSEEMEDGDQFDQVPGALVRFSFEELHLATEGFKQKLGEGGFGSVFRGTLGNGNKVAVKKLEGLDQGRKEFMAEVETIGSIHHINLVELIGFCAEKSHRLLVYEYMSNGSLDQWIFTREDEEATTSLDWQTKRNIIHDIAKGLCYLHEECRQRIAHLDIKPQNILLNENFQAKVADFGMSKLIDREQREVMTRMRGTPGYLAPEWLTSIITEMVDVYSFGVVVLEILCGRKNLDPSQPEEAVQLIALLETFKENSLPEIFLKNNSSIQCDDEDAIKLIRLAMWCLQSDSKRRPAMSMVVKVLEGLEDVESNLDYDFFRSYQTFSSLSRS